MLLIYNSMRSQKQIDNIKKTFSDPYIVDNFVTQKEIELFDMKCVGLQQVYQFLGALVMESKLGEIREKNSIEEEIAKATQQMEVIKWEAE